MTGGDHRAAQLPAVQLVGAFVHEHVGISYLERNPAPGTRGEAPRPASEIDLRAEARNCIER